MSAASASCIFVSFPLGDKKLHHSVTTLLPERIIAAQRAHGWHEVGIRLAVSGGAGIDDRIRLHEIDEAELALRRDMSGQPAPLLHITEIRRHEVDDGQSWRPLLPDGP
jgi:hypothetical protein